MVLEGTYGLLYPVLVQLITCTFVDRGGVEGIKTLSATSRRRVEHKTNFLILSLTYFSVYQQHRVKNHLFGEDYLISVDRCICVLDLQPNKPSRTYASEVTPFDGSLRAYSLKAMLNTTKLCIA